MKITNKGKEKEKNLEAWCMQMSEALSTHTLFSQCLRNYKIEAKWKFNFTLCLSFYHLAVTEIINIILTQHI